LTLYTRSLQEAPPQGFFKDQALGPVMVKLIKILPVGE